MERLDDPAESFANTLEPEVMARIRPGDTLFDLLQRRDLRISYRREVERPLNLPHARGRRQRPYRHPGILQ
jgi:hypothetical protein